MDKREEMQKEFDNITSSMIADAMSGATLSELWGANYKLWQFFEKSISQARSQAYAECLEIVSGFHHGYTDQGAEGIYRHEADVCTSISKAIREAASNPDRGEK